MQVPMRASVKQGVIALAWILALGHAKHAAAQTALTNDRGARDEESAWSLLRQHVHPWERYVRGFRREHHFAVSFGSAPGEWRVTRFGGLANRRYQSQGVFGKVQYSFHLPISGSFGYFLGSSFGYALTGIERQDEFTASSSLHLPGFLVGLVWNLTPSWRLLVGFDHYLERLSALEDHVSTPHKRLEASMLAMVDAMVMVDMFYDLNWAIRLEGHWREVKYAKPKNAGERVEDAELARSERCLGVGMVYHFL